MSSLNSVVVIGCVTRDPVLRYSSNGAPICSFSITTSRHSTKKSGRRVKETTVVDVVAHRRLGEICAEFLKKGRKILVLGRLRFTRSVDPKTKKPRSKLRIVSRHVQFLHAMNPPDEEAKRPTPRRSDARRSLENR